MNIRGTKTERRSESIASNRPESRGLHPVGALARTHRKKSLPIGGRRERNNKYKRSEQIANNRPESRGLHPVGALARTHWKKSLPIGGRPEKQTSMKDLNRLRTIGPNLGDYTQWVRLRAPTGSKVSRLEES